MNETAKIDVQPVPRISLSVAEAAEALGIGSKMAYELVAQGVIPSFCLRGRRLVPVAGLAECVERLTGG